jgi:hypothetical protein
MTPYHAEITAIQQQIETLLASPEVTGVAGGEFRAAPATAEIVRNQFAVPATGTGNPEDDAEPVFDASLTRIVDEIRRIDLAPAQQDLASLHARISESRTNSTTAVGRMVERAHDELGRSSPVTMTSITQATSSVPVNGFPTGASFLSICLAAVATGSVVALNLNPARRRRRFRSLSQLQHRLGIPVIGAVANRPLVRLPVTWRGAAASHLLTICEWALVAFGLLIAAAIVCNSQVASTFAENPFHGVTQAIWSLAPHRAGP